MLKPASRLAQTGGLTNFKRKLIEEKNSCMDEDNVLPTRTRTPTCFTTSRTIQKHWFPGHAGTLPDDL